MVGAPPPEWDASAILSEAEKRDLQARQAGMAARSKSATGALPGQKPTMLNSLFGQPNPLPKGFHAAGVVHTIGPESPTRVQQLDRLRDVRSPFLKKRPLAAPNAYRVDLMKSGLIDTDAWLEWTPGSQFPRKEEPALAGPEARGGEARDELTRVEKARIHAFMRRGELPSDDIDGGCHRGELPTVEVAQLQKLLLQKEQELELEPGVPWNQSQPTWDGPGSAPPLTIPVKSELGRKLPKMLPFKGDTLNHSHQTPRTLGYNTSMVIDRRTFLGKDEGPSLASSARPSLNGAYLDPFWAGPSMPDKVPHECAPLS
jgi:hypothetical protein